MFALHIDMNFAAFKKEALKHLLNLAAAVGYDTIVWEIENKVQLETLGSAVHPGALSKTDFRELLDLAEQLNLKSIPLLQTLGHAEYVLETAEFQSLRENHFPDCYCTSNPTVRNFLKKLISEILELFGPVEYFHLGGDEAYNYGTCPVCSGQDKCKMFIEHEMELASVLSERGIRPCLWADMLRHHPEVRKTFDRRFVVWLWNYSYTEKWEDEEALRRAGYDLVICPASSSYGDSPFLPQWEKHAANIAGAAAVASANHALGLCITSWSIRMGLKITQLPLWELGAAIYLHHQNFRETEKIVQKKYFGCVDPDIPGEWDLYLMQISGVQWTRYKDGLTPPPGHFAKQLKAEPEAYLALSEKLSAMIEKSRSVLPLIPCHPEVMRQYAAGAKIRLRYLEQVLNLLKGIPCSGSEIRQCRTAFAEYLAQEQTRDSADHNARLIFDPMIEYAESKIGRETA